MEQAFEVLKTFDWGGDRGALTPITQAITTGHGKPEVLGPIQARLLEIVTGTTPRPGKEFACRQLALMGNADAAKGLAPLLLDGETADMARFALEQIPESAASAVLIDALDKTSGVVCAGIALSLGRRGAGEAVPALTAHMTGTDPTVAKAAAAALGRIADAPARQALTAAKAQVTDPVVLRTIEDGLKRCAEGGQP